MTSKYKKTQRKNIRPPYIELCEAESRYPFSSGFLDTVRSVRRVELTHEINECLARQGVNPKGRLYLKNLCANYLMYREEHCARMGAKAQEAHVFRVQKLPHAITVLHIHSPLSALDAPLYAGTYEQEDDLPEPIRTRYRSLLMYALSGGNGWVNNVGRHVEGGVYWVEINT